MNTQRKQIIGLVTIVLLAAAGTGAVALLNTEGPTPVASTQTNNKTPSAQQPDAQTPTSTAQDNYKDGTYSASGSYRTPGGTESIDVTATLKDSTITNLSVSTNGSGESREYQAMFKQGVNSLVVGKSIDEANVSRVSGSSLTSAGFNRALDAIKQDARA